MLGWLKNQRRSLVGLIPTLVVMIAVVVVQQRFTYLRTSIEKTVPGLETAKLYLKDFSYTPCIGDVVGFRSSARRSRYYRAIAAIPGDRFAITENGYQVNETSVAADPAWVIAARANTKEHTGEATVPEGKVVIVNADYDAKRDYNNWAYEFIPADNIRSTVTHILYTRDFRRIGERITKGSDRCIR